jgi:predicted ATP-grasp superfamily ATP-dependent carboligase
MYAGALENHPGLVDRIELARPLWGNAGDRLRRVRDPLRLAEALRAAGLLALDVRASARGLPRDGRWLAKPLASSSGHGIRPLDASGRTPRKGFYYQERARGTPLSALFVASPSTCLLLGVTWQWLGRPGAPFGYRGSVGPWLLSKRERMRVQAMGQAVARAFLLVGLFGIDFVLSDGEPWATEVNPRYTASVEVLELALGRSLLAEHIRACTEGAGEIGARRSRPREVVGKAILYAERPLVFTRELEAPGVTDWFDVPRVADIPRAGTHFRPGEPVCTVFASAPTIPACRARLRRALARWSDRLEPVSAG